MDSTSEEIADDPAHRLMKKPTETRSAWPLCSIADTFSCSSPSTTSEENTPCITVSTCCWTASMASGPNQCPTNPTRPSRASSSGAVESADQKAPSALSRNSESRQAFDSVRPMILRTRWCGTSRAVGTVPVPG